MDYPEISKRLHPLERKVVPHIKKDVSFESLIKNSGLKDVEVMRALQWLENKDLLTIKKEPYEVIDLEKNGLLYKKKGLPEKRFLEEIKDSPKPMSKLSLQRDEINVCIGLLKRKGAIDVKKDKEPVFSITSKGKELLKEKSPEEKFLRLDFPVRDRSLDDSQKKAAKDLLSRKEIIRQDKRSDITIIPKKGVDFSKLVSDKDTVDRLTPKMLKSGKWKDAEFREFDVEINVPEIYGGKRHYTMQVVEYIKQIWLDLGFKEMTGNMIHTNFWDLDSLFVPQDHPAREMQDTFYVKQPKTGKLPSKELVERVKKTHEHGWNTGSLGWRSNWSREKSEELLLRTHTTVLSARTISRLKKEDLPAKFFAVGKCFRNETLDWKHLFEFYQVEGIVVDPDVNFRHLLGYLKNFFKKMGFPDVRIRPGHFPYTEPSAEVDVWHPKKKEWVELGGSGIFRPEVTKPLMGFEVPVLAWGLGLGRLMKEYWDIQDMRDLYRNDLKQLREQKIWLK